VYYPVALVDQHGLVVQTALVYASGDAHSTIRGIRWHRDAEARPTLERRGRYGEIARDLVNPAYHLDGLAGSSGASVEEVQHRACERGPARATRAPLTAPNRAREPSHALDVR
jgi:hypothetical protein